LFVRVSATDWVAGGLTVEEVSEVTKDLAGRGVDLIDVSSGGNSPAQQIVSGPGYQVAFAALIRRDSGLPTAAVGLITEAEQAEQVLADRSADAVLLARAVLRNPHWPQEAARTLGDEVYWPKQYERARLH
jgi:2,4-dienoyl-CoA reductase-like NADH-dependent reductase (Old Yellow Enzyme family)